MLSGKDHQRSLDILVYIKNNALYMRFLASWGYKVSGLFYLNCGNGKFLRDLISSFPSKWISRFQFTQWILQRYLLTSNFIHLLPIYDTKGVTLDNVTRLGFSGVKNGVGLVLKTAIFLNSINITGWLVARDMMS